MKQWKPGSEPLTVAETNAIAERARKRGEVFHEVKVLALTVLFLYAVLFGAIKVIHLAGGL